MPLNSAAIFSVSYRHFRQTYRVQWRYQDYTLYKFIKFSSIYLLTYSVAYLLNLYLQQFWWCGLNISQTYVVTKLSRCYQSQGLFTQFAANSFQQENRITDCMCWLKRWYRGAMLFCQWWVSRWQSKRNSGKLVGLATRNEWESWLQMASTSTGSRTLYAVHAT